MLLFGVSYTLLNCQLVMVFGVMYSVTRENDFSGLS